MRSALHIVLFVLLLLLMGCAQENRWDCFSSMGELRSEIRELPAFDAIYTQHRIDLIYRYDSSYRVEVLFGENLLEHIQTEVVGGELHLDNTARCNWVRDLSVYPQVTIYAPHFSRFENRGNGNITFEDTLYTSHFTYEAFEANGTARMLLHTTECDLLLHTGRSALEAHGLSDVSRIFLGGVGALDASGLLSQTTLANNSSVQRMSVYSSGYLYAFIKRSGDVCYAGNPQEIELDNPGSGLLQPCGP